MYPAWGPQTIGIGAGVRPGTPPKGVANTHPFSPIPTGVLGATHEGQVSGIRDGDGSPDPARLRDGGRGGRPSVRASLLGEAHPMSSRSLRPALCAVVGAAGAGKRTLCHGLTDLLGGDAVTSLSLDDYVAQGHVSGTRRDVPPHAAASSELNLMAQHLRLLRQGETVFKPVYDRLSGRFAEPEFLRPQRTVLAQGMHGLDTPELRALWDVSLYVASSREEADIARDVAMQIERADASLRLQAHGEGQGWDAEFRIAHPVPLPALDELQHDPAATPYLRIERASGGAYVIELSGRVDDVSHAHMQARLLSALPDSPARRPLRLGVIPRAAAGDCRSNLLALSQLIVAHYFVQKGRLLQAPTLAAARSAHPVPGA